MKIKLVLEFDGTAYVGWQRQANGISVQQRLEEALARICGGPVTVSSSGRTDAGVHAAGMVAHFTTPRVLPLTAFREGVNRFLPPDVAVKSAVVAADDFHARFSACGKWYRYALQTGATRRPLVARTSWHLPLPLDLPLMQAAAADLVGRHDFARFRTSGCDARTTEREIFSCRVTRRDDLLLLDVCGNGFLRHMVRIIAGTLVEIGLGKRPADDIPRLLAGAPQVKSGLTAPAHGLCLMEVWYAPAPGPAGGLPTEPGR